MKYTLDPWVVRWEQSMCRVLFSESEKPTFFIKFNVDGLLRGDYVSRMSGYATARQNGWMSANDIRELENLDRIAPDLGGDLYLINGAMPNSDYCIGGNLISVRTLDLSQEWETIRQQLDAIVPKYLTVGTA